jgi:hypothetical protein
MLLEAQHPEHERLKKQGRVTPVATRGLERYVKDSSGR